MLDLALFRARSYRGVILSAIAIFGVLFTMPQYFQGVLGTSPMGSGLRLLPMIGGLVLAAVPADRIARLVGAKIAVAVGFAILAAGLLIGTRTGVASGSFLIAAWTALVGLGMGACAGDLDVGRALRLGSDVRVGFLVVDEHRADESTALIPRMARRKPSAARRA